ncbi:MAG: hypothetical protein L3J28_13545 [Candidatus Polarisedimenticolaceae bacterium]|nr:hypothetical protein [Candidatus Polarisedimenticolaceae bacterium]
MNLINDNFSDTCGWISDRINSYSFDPLIIAHAIQNTNNVKIFATVTYKDQRKRTAYLEDMFPDDIQISDFNSLPAAIAWVKETLNKS